MYICVMFPIFESINDATAFHTQLNSVYPALVNDCTLPVLDVLVRCKDGLFITSVYRKSTFTGLYTNWNASVPMSCKTNLIPTLAQGALMIFFLSVPLTKKLTVFLLTVVFQPMNR